LKKKRGGEKSILQKKPRGPSSRDAAYVGDGKTNTHRIRRGKSQSEGGKVAAAGEKKKIKKEGLSAAR